MLDQDIKKLEDLVKKMESGQLSLEDNLKVFQEGIDLVRHCQKTIENAEIKIKEIVEDSQGNFKEVDLKKE